MLVAIWLSFQCIAFCQRVFVGNFFCSKGLCTCVQLVYIFPCLSKHWISSIHSQFSSSSFCFFEFFFFLFVCRHFLCTGNHRKQFSAASKIKRSMNQYLCWKCVLVAFSIIFLLLLLVLLFIHCCCLLSFDSVSHQSEGRTVQTISEYKLSLNLLQGELFS